MKKTVERLPLPPKLIRVMEIARQEMRETGKRPNMCISDLGLSDDEKHIVLGEFAYHASQARKAKAYRRRLVEEKGAMFSLMFVSTATTAKTTDQRSSFVTLPTQPSSKPQIVQEDLFPAMLRGCYNDCRRPRSRSRR
jgi:hypothetical protein